MYYGTTFQGRSQFCKKRITTVPGRPEVPSGSEKGTFDLSEKMIDVVIKIGSKDNDTCPNPYIFIRDRHV